MKPQGSFQADRGVFFALLVLALCSCATRPYYRDGRDEGFGDVSFSDEEILQKIILVGDGGDSGGFRPVARHLATIIDERSFLVYLGDNTYVHDDLSAPESRSARTLLAQIEVGDAGAGVLFVPGNHDWEEAGGFALSHPMSLDALMDQEKFLVSHGAEFLPPAGSPGPSVRLVGGVKIIVLDTQWWLLPDDVRTAYPGMTEATVLRDLDRELQTGEPVKIVVAHHPLETHGKHGGYFPWYTHLLPPVLGSLYVLARNLGVTDQDISSEMNRHLVGSLERAMSAHPPLIVAAGHEHALQVLSGETANFVLVSGGGSKAGEVSFGERTLFSDGRRGFMVLYLLTGNRVALRAFSVDQEGQCLGPSYSRWLSGTLTSSFSADLPSSGSLPMNPGE